MNELKPCPFCGGKAELVCAPGYFKTGLSSSGWIIKCLNGCCNQMPYGSDHDAIEAWNRRAGDDPTIEPERSLWFRIGEICVDESKGFISPGRAVEKIRQLLREAERQEK